MIDGLDLASGCSRENLNRRIVSGSAEPVEGFAIQLQGHLGLRVAESSASRGQL